MTEGRKPTKSERDAAKRKREIAAAWDELTRFKSFWILDEDRVPKVAKDIDDWHAFVMQDFEKRNRVGDTETATMRVSTVFLGVDHNHWGKGPPILFETMIFTLDQFPREYEGKISFSPDDLNTYRYSTWDDAEAGHNAVVKRIQKAEADALADIGKIKTEREP